MLETVIANLGLRTSPEELLKNITAMTARITRSPSRPDDGDPARAAAIANAIVDQLIAEAGKVGPGSSEIQTSVKAYLKSTTDQIATTQTQVANLTGNQNRTAAQDAQLTALQDQLVTLRQTYASLLAYLSTSSTNQLSIIEPAVAPDIPISPRPLLNTSSPAILGLLIRGGRRPHRGLPGRPDQDPGMSRRSSACRRSGQS